MKSLIFIVLIVYSSKAEVLSSIPGHLVDCYRSGGPLLNSPRRLDVFLSLVRKLEHSAKLDMRLFSTSLLRRFRLDGIEQASNPIETEFVLPYRASAFQFHKYKLLMDLFLPSQNLLEMDESLTLVERCLLHKLLSSTVQPWERGDENLTCPLSAQQRENMSTDSSGRIHSRCPIEDGVIQTDWGPVAVGTIIAAIAASLESQRVSLTDIFSANIYKSEVSQPMIDRALADWEKQVENPNDNNNIANFEMLASATDELNISNILVATIVGDLAEVVVNQGPRVGASAQLMTVGSNNRWNDTLLPRDFYLLPQNSNDWQFTDAEILAGVDGLILASYVPSWIELRRSFRLSQVLDSYYSNDGVSFGPEVRACNRLALYNRVLNNTILASETLRFAQVLSLTQNTVYIPLEEMQRMSDAAVTAFIEYVPSVLRKYQRNCVSVDSVPVVDLIVATDSSWREYDVEQFLSWMSGALELDASRSTLGVVHGNTGRWVAPPAHNITALFTHIANYTDPWPNRLNVPNVLTTVNQHLRNQTLQDINAKASAGRSTVILILSPTDQPSGNEIERSRTIMHSIRSSFFDAYFAYAAQDLTNFQNINNEYLDYSEMFITLPSTCVQDVASAINTFMIKNDIPKRIFGAACPSNGTTFYQIEYEDSVMAKTKRGYRIHPFYLRQQPLIRVQFRNSNYGTILVCMFRGAEATQSCQLIGERNIHTFNLTAPCPSPDFCPPAHFVVTATTTLNACAHADCRTPNQVDYYIQHSGLRCLPLLGSGAAPSNHWKVNLGLSLVILILYLN
ncbi:PREDICTED: uncharacterized protein LOC106124033 [Papilio xuthus]|uniref:Uncharacterized protein LOC106124033 n=1 Tax=Papilio xuthus TaxID=66420 RepID=A0AAJ7EFX8_PAPXU|nr:PREDICTED: uncharacterized protein LOC106124033 [Papilio xuthus]